MGVLVVVLFLIVLLIKGRSDEGPTISDEEADEIFSDDADEKAKEADEEEGDHLSLRDVEEIESGPERLS
ncbi:MAG: hypothetical protein GWN18_00135 [Thermoplasmata archaeon]|nr:hypothetical protein [Thermoplasmata archaeon]NIS10375.1 hypothetical protein [Thermoplasmata archaeon]NIV77176.1 hypothetical protein [Thermoplasmata archaeon]NIW81000.1 hypothetical protein [Thermoplasmata archaeon]NIW87209.1 hypothetical protein [Thermoplasmata archaeon]